MIAAAVALPVTATAVTAVASSGVAGAAPKIPPPALNCSIGGSVAFASPGLSVDGVVAGVGKESTTTSTTTLGTCTTGSSDTASIVKPITTKNAKCDVVVTPQTATVNGIPVTAPFTEPPACPTGKAAKKAYYDDLAWTFATGAGSDLATALKKGIVVDDVATPVTLEVAPTDVTTVDPGGACGSEVGFELSGAVKKWSTLSYELLVCLGADTGTNTSGTFFADIAQMVLAPGTSTGILVSSVNVDTSDSFLSIS
jgi:hypothetical protein